MDDIRNKTDRNSDNDNNINSKNINHKGKKSRRTLCAMIALMTALVLIFTGCGSTGADAEAAETAIQTTSAADSAADDPVSKADMFTERDLSGEYDEDEALRISLDGSTASVTAEGTETTSAGISIDGSTITITAEGTYIFTGTLTDGQIAVDVDESSKVQIVLDGASITSSDSAAIYVKSADKVFITTAAGTENTLANGGTFADANDSSIDGAVYARDDITFNGSGSLTITSPAGHGIVGNDDVKVAGGTITITAAKHGIKGNDSVRLAEATVTITCGTDGIHVSESADEDSDEASDSFFYIADGSLTISAGDDGIHADAQALIEGGSIEITESYEGIEALEISISGGSVDLTATDDGLNAAGGSSSGSNTFGSDDWFGGQGGGFDEGGTDGVISISGGSIHITCGGDGVDSNGSITISGGYTVVEGPAVGDTSVLDYNTSAVITGGTFIGTGGAGMAENFSGAENQGIITVSTGNQSAGQTVTLTDANGTVIAEVTPGLDYAVVYISTPDVTQGSTYTLTAGTCSRTIELSSSIYSELAGGMGGGPMGMNGMNGQGGMPAGGPEMGQGGNGFHG